MVSFIEGAAVIACLALAWTLYNHRRNGKLPPGPRGWPIIGNKFDMPKVAPWLAYKRWSEEYGSDVISVHVNGSRRIILNSAKAAVDLMERRSALYSDRPPAVMLKELVGYDFSIAFMDYGERWRGARRAFHQHFRPNALHDYHPKVTKWVKELTRRVLDEPEEFMEHIVYWPGSMIMDITFGVEPKAKHDPYIEAAEAGIDTINLAGTPGYFLVDYIPALKYLPDWFPGAGFKRLAKEWRKPTMDMITLPWDFVQEGIKNRNAPPSVLLTMLENLDGKADADVLLDQARCAAATAYAAGSHTSVSALQSFYMAMLLYPEVYQKGREEIDRVIGKDRLPTIEDEPQLPYIAAILKEVTRWNPVLPMALAHRLTQDDEYNGYHLPAGSVIIGNTWAILRDEKRYPRADQFIPERFLTKDGQVDPSAPDPVEAFGYGRRICPGRHLADTAVFLAIATSLWAFDISCPLDQYGKPIKPSGEYTSGLLTYPKPFKCVITPRNPEARELLNASN